MRLQVIDLHSLLPPSLEMKFNFPIFTRKNLTADSQPNASNSDAGSSSTPPATSPELVELTPSGGQSESNQPDHITAPSNSAPMAFDHVALLSAVTLVEGSENSPIGPLPPEILLEIFGYACTSFLNFHLFPEGNFVSPLFLGKICRGWRGIVWSTPELWTYIDLTLSRERYDTQVDLFTAWVIRSQLYAQIYLFAVTIRGEGPNEIEWNANPPFPIFVWLGAVGSRGLCYLDTFVPEPSTRHFDFFSNRVPNLSVLSLRPPAGLVCSHADFLITGFASAPNLRQLALHSFGKPNILITEHALQHVRFTDCFSEDLLKSLCDHPHLISADLTIKKGDVGSISEGCHFPYLRELKLRTFDDGTMQDILRGLSVPQLTLLSLSFTEPSYILPLADTAAMIHRSGCQLQKLIFTNGCIREWDLFGCLSVTSTSLLELDLQPYTGIAGSGISDAVIRALGVPCPCCSHTLITPLLQKFAYVGPVWSRSSNSSSLTSAIQRFFSRTPRVSEMGKTELGKVLLDTLGYRRKPVQVAPVAHGAAPELVAPANSPDIQPHSHLAENSSPTPHLTTFTIISTTVMDFKPEIRTGLQHLRDDGLDLRLEFGGISM